MTDKIIFDEVVCSLHQSDSLRQNVWDYLSAKAIQEIYWVKAIRFLHNTSSSWTNWNAIYWGWWMLRPWFSSRRVNYHFSRSQGKHAIIWIWINRDHWMPDFTSEDISNIRKWVESAIFVSVRDFESQEFLESKVKSWQTLEVEPCPSYIYIENTFQDFQTDKLVWIVPSFWHTGSYIPFMDSMNQLITDASKRYSQDQILILCHDISDYNYARLHFPHVESALIREFSDVIKQYWRCQWVITARAHWIIFSAAVNRRVSYILLSDKMNSLSEYHFASKTKAIWPNFDLNFHEATLEKQGLPIKRCMSSNNFLVNT